jgi:hypothetical protein
MESAPGTYALVLESEKKQTARVGKLGSFVIHPDFYINISR